MNKLSDRLQAFIADGEIPLSDALGKLIDDIKAAEAPLVFIDGGISLGDMDKLLSELKNSSPGEIIPVPRPTLTVWYGAMPETNGKTNWTAILHRKGECLSTGITIDRSEYPDRVRYEADRMRHLIGELAGEPDILAYDADAHSGYVAPHKDSPDREMLKRLAVILSGSDTPGEIRSLTVTAQSFVDRCKALAEERLYPEKLPCPVRLEPGLLFGKGVTTSTMLSALQRRAEYYTELEAMTPEEREKHDASIEEFKAMLPQGDMPLSVRANGEANSYTLLKDGNWFANILMNGEMTVPQHWDFLNSIAKKQ